jgi:hypothetical protein
MRQHLRKSPHSGPATKAAMLLAERDSWAGRAPSLWVKKTADLPQAFSGNPQPRINGLSKGWTGL